MDPIGVGVGLAAIGYGLYTAWARQVHPEQFWKLGPMKEQWGEGGGTALHVFGYTVMPILLGALLLFNGLHGVPMFPR